MPAAYKPADYPDASVYIVVPDASALIVFLKNVFGATELRRFDAGPDKVAHAELRIGDSVVMLCDAVGSCPAFPVWLHLYVPDARATYAKAMRSGGNAVQEPIQKDGDPDLRGGFADPAGNTWWVSTQQS